jgi:hypothetical protein
MACSFSAWHEIVGHPFDTNMRTCGRQAHPELHPLENFSLCARREVVILDWKEDVKDGARSYSKDTDRM